MDKQLASQLAKEPDNFIEFNRRAVQLKRLAGGIRNQKGVTSRNGNNRTLVRREQWNSGPAVSG